MASKMGVFDDKVTTSNVALPSFSDATSLMKSGADIQIKALDKLTPAVQRFEDEKKQIETDSFKMQLLEADSLPPEQRHAARLTLLANAEQDGSTQWFNKADIAKEFRTRELADAQEGRAIADQLMQQESHDRLEEAANYDITQRPVAEEEKRLDIKKTKQTIKIEDAKELRTQADHDYASRPEYRARVEKKEIREANLEKEDYKNKMIDHKSSDLVTGILRDTNTSVGFNTALKKHYDNGFTDPGSKAQSKANEYARMEASNITPESINTVIKDPNDPKAYTKANYNSIIFDEFKRLKKLHPYADEKLLMDNAHEAVKRTDAGTKFQKQQWYEELTRPAAYKEMQRERKAEVTKAWRDNVNATIRAFDSLKKNRTSYSKDQFREQLANLNRLYEADPDSLGPGAKTQLASWSNKAIADYTQEEFRPVDSYTSTNQRTVTDDQGDVHKIPLDISDFSPTKQKNFIDAEVKKITDEFPYADREQAKKAVLTKIKNSGLAVKFAEGALPAALAAANNKFRFETAKTRSDRRHKILQGISTTPGNNVHSYTLKFLETKFEREGQKLDPDQRVKLNKELSNTLTKWKSYIPGWKKLPLASKETYQIAMFDLLSGATIDKDANFLWMDPDDYSLPAIQGASTTGDMSGVAENYVLTALVGKISPYGTGIDSQGKYSGPKNSVLVAQLEEKIKKLNKTKADAAKAFLGASPEGKVNLKANLMN